MIPNSSKTENLAIHLPITAEIRRVAHQFAARQPTPEKAEQVLLNTIAVSIVNNYLNMLGIATNLSGSDSWNPVMQLCENVADLVIPEVGTLECRPVQSTANSCHIPLPVWDLCIGYTVVQIDDFLKKAAILGFTPQVATEELLLSHLEPPEASIARIHELKALNINTFLINLGQWFNNIFEVGWQTVDSIFQSEQLITALGLRSGELADSQPSGESPLTRAKLIDFGIQLSDCNVVLLVQLSPDSNNEIEVLLRVLPQPERIYLPETLKLKVLETPDRVFMEAQARERDNYIQLQFNGRPQETFQVEIILNDLKFSQHFQL